MYKRQALLLLGCAALCVGREPIKPKHGSINFLVYFRSRHRGLCEGMLVSRAAALTAAVCVTNPTFEQEDRRPITVVTSSTYRHPRRGVRMQVTKVLLPNLRNVSNNYVYLIQKSPAVLLLREKVPDVLAEVPMRALDVDWRGEEHISLQEECFMAGWHFFYKGDKIYQVNKFLLQRNVRVQFMNVVKKNEWCEALSLKFQKALASMGVFSHFDEDGWLCAKDPDRSAQPCHGMYGAPLVCRGRAVGLMMAPDAQWSNCTGFSNTIHLFSGYFLRPFMECISSLFDPDIREDWIAMKKNIMDDPYGGEYDYVPAIYDKFDYTSNESD